MSRTNDNDGGNAGLIFIALVIAFFLGLYMGHLEHRIGQSIDKNAKQLDTNR
jgi:hypothetical protein